MSKGLATSMRDASIMEVAVTNIEHFTKYSIYGAIDTIAIMVINTSNDATISPQR